MAEEGHLRAVVAVRAVRDGHELDHGREEAVDDAVVARALDAGHEDVEALVLAVEVSRAPLRGLVLDRADAGRRRAGRARVKPAQQQQRREEARRPHRGQRF